MSLHRNLSFAISLILLLITAGAAAAGEWKVVRSTGQVWIGSNSAQSVALYRASELPNGATITTGGGSRVLLARGKETMVIGPNSVVEVPSSIAGKTTILQRAGHVVFDVDRRNVKHFTVGTPYLAAVVKGTRFTIDVDAGGATVFVNRGLVEVTGFVAGEVVEISPGQRAEVRGSQKHLLISGWGVIAKIKKIKPRPPWVGSAHPANGDGLAYGLVADRSATPGRGVAAGHAAGNSTGNGNGNSAGSRNVNGNSGGSGNGNGN